jgi:GNAT superfamily N-acetyltransferase
VGVPVGPRRDTLPSVIEISPYAGEADEQRGLDVYNAIWPEDRIGVEEARSYRAGQLDNVDLLARIDGAVGGSAIGSIQPQWPGFVAAFVSVLPTYRRRGVGTALYVAISTWAREHGLDTIEAIVHDDDPDSLGFARRRGFAEHSHENGVSLDLTRIEPPKVEPPDGVQITTWAERPELARGMYEVMLEAAPDIPGGEDETIEPFEHWLAHDMQGPGDRPDATFVAVADDEVIGYAKFSLSVAQTTTAHHDLTGVKRAWRGRGVARALKATQIAWAKANGYEELRTRNDERNAPIRHLNEEFGYRPTVGRIYVRGPLA